MKKALPIALALVAGLILVWMRGRAPAPEGVSPERAPAVEQVAQIPEELPQPVPVDTPVVSQADVAAALPVIVAPGDESEATTESLPSLAPEQALEALRLTIRNYGLRYRGNPVGNNVEITAALTGNNPNGVHFLDAARDGVNPEGALVDGWGTPYFFHQLAALEMEIRSAGPDRTMWTPDDLVTR